ncbi:MAG: C-GCAxxG-C-C family (seleno)protein [Terracidiphilus sp.]
MLYKRGKVYWYNFRWSIKQADGTVESFRIRQSAKTQSKNAAKDVEEEHRRALRLGEIHPNDPWPKPATSGPPIFRAFAKEFLHYAKTHTKPGTHTFYSVCLDRLLTFAAIADAPLDAITGETVSRYARHRQEVPENSVVTVNGDLRTLRRILHLAVEWGRLGHAPTIHELPQSKGRDRVLSFAEEAKYLAKASENLRDAAILAVDTGMRCGKTCGALTGGCCVLGLSAGKGTAEEEADERLALMLSTYVEWFEAEFTPRFGGIDCAAILAGDPRNKLARCPTIVAESLAKLEEILAENGYDYRVA